MGDSRLQLTPPAVFQQDTPSLEELKLKYYQLLIRYHSHNNSYIDICRCYKAIYETDSIADDPEKWKPVSAYLQCSNTCLIMSINNPFHSQLLTSMQHKQWKLQLELQQSTQSRCVVACTIHVAHKQILDFAGQA